MLHRKIASRHGFTLVESVVVVAILAAVATLGVTKMLRTVDSAKRTAAESDLKHLREAFLDPEVGYLRDMRGIPGFSVVLLIIAIVTHLAMRQLGSVRDQKLVTVANRQLQEIRDSVFCRGLDGMPTGFLSDMGRLVVATNGTLSELWQKPAGARPFAVRPAVRENLAKGVSSDLISSDVFVATGWRGPYLRLPIGKTRLMDPWGNPLENPDAAGYDRLGVTNGFAMSVTHFGPTALSRDPQRQTISLVPDGGMASRLIVQVVSTSGTATNSVTYKWFGPCDGLITGACAKAVQYGVAARFEGLRPGVRTVWDSASKTSRLVDVKPGDNQIEIRIP